MDVTVVHRVVVQVTDHHRQRRRGRLHRFATVADDDRNGVLFPLLAIKSHKNKS